MDLRGLTAFCMTGLVGWIGCDTLSSVHSGVQDTTSSIKSGESTTDSTKQDFKAHSDKLQGKDGAGGSGKPGEDDDGTRLTAKEAKPNEVLTDDVGVKKNDLADWRKFDLTGNAGLVKIKLRWDDPKADLNIDLMDAFGESVAASPGKQREPEKKIVARIQPGQYYVRVQPAPVADPKAVVVGSVYTMKLEWTGPPPAGAAPVAGQVPPPGGAVPPGGAAPVAPPIPAVVYPAAGDPQHPRCLVVQAYRDDDGRMMLFLDRGSDAGFKVGMNGTLLNGKEGDVPADGGGFKIIKVIDKQKSVAKGEMSSVGKNKRARVDIVKPVM